MRRTVSRARGVLFILLGSVVSLTLFGTLPADALIAVPSFVITPGSGVLGTTFTGDVEFYSGVPGQPNHGCTNIVSYTVADPNGNLIAQGSIPANDPGPPQHAYSFQVTPSAPNPTGTYTVDGTCDGFNAHGQFDVIAPTSPTPVLTLTPAAQTHAIDESATVTATLVDGSTAQPIGGTLLSFAATGPNTKSTGTCLPVSCLTDANGNVSWTYAGSQTGRDFVVAQIGPMPLNGGPSASTTVEWTPSINGSQYAALGDSFSSGEGTDSYIAGTDISGHNMCHRSLSAYGPMLDFDRNLGSFAFQACSGAVTADLYGPNSSHNLGDNGQPEPAQLCQVTAKAGGIPACPAGILPALGTDTKTVTVTIGGNDAGFVPLVSSCLFVSKVHLNFGEPGRGCATQPAIFLPPLQRLAALAGFTSGVKTPDGQAIHSIPSLLAAIHLVAPNARVYIAGYPRLFGANANQDCLVGALQTNIGTLELKITPRDAAWLDGLAGLMNTVISRSAAAAGGWATFVDPTKAFTGHGVCTALPWINQVSGTATVRFANLVNQQIASRSVHPTFTGQELGYEAAFLANKVGQ
jgi:hypothetical protein